MINLPGVKNEAVLERQGVLRSGLKRFGPVSKRSLVGMLDRFYRDAQTLFPAGRKIWLHCMGVSV